LVRGKRPGTRPHPSTVINTGTDLSLEQQRELAEEDLLRIEALPGWDEFTLQEREFLIVLPAFGNLADAAKEVNRSAAWARAEMKANPVFDKAVELRGSQKKAIVDGYLDEHWGRAIIGLVKMATESGSEATRLRAIRLMAEIRSGAVGTKQASPGLQELKQAISFNVKWDPTTEWERKQREDLRLTRYAKGQLIEGEAREAKAAEGEGTDDV
jgi:hypothetical protein